jgi:hypothetical protein
MVEAVFGGAESFEGPSARFLIVGFHFRRKLMMAVLVGFERRFQLVWYTQAVGPRKRIYDTASVAYQKFAGYLDLFLKKWKNLQIID